MKTYIGNKKVQAERMNEYEAVELGYARPNKDNHEWREGYLQSTKMGVILGRR